MSELGSRELSPAPGIVTSTMRMDYRDCMDEALARFKAHVKSGRKAGIPMRQNVYSFAYWLFRHSGMVQPSEPWRKERDERPA